jgi:TPP-dependent indolepyruvate ferredoxin oxidoreductase alpha subunit
MKAIYSRAIAQTLEQLGVTVVTHVPGYGGTESFNAVKEVYKKDFSISFHEEVAYTIAHGAALVGTRAASIMKTHGFGKATNSILHSLYSGTTAGLVTFLFDDPEGAHSDNILDIQPFVAGSSVPHKVVDPTKVQSQITEAYKESERLGLPYFLLLDCRDVNKEVAFKNFTAPVQPNKYIKNAFQHVVCPFASQYQYQVLKAKQKEVSWQSVIEPTLRLDPKTFAGTAKSFVQEYETFFSVFKNLRGNVVTGDASTPSIYALSPFECIDLVTYLGGSTPLALGAFLAGYKDTWAITGDFSFIAAGHLGLLEAIQREIPLKLIIFNNAKAGATGGQEINNNLLKLVLAGYTRFIKNINDPQNVTEIENVLKEANAANEMRIIVLNYLA